MLNPFQTSSKELNMIINSRDKAYILEIETTPETGVEIFNR